MRTKVTLVFARCRFKLNNLPSCQIETFDDEALVSHTQEGIQWCLMDRISKA